MNQPSFRLLTPGLLLPVLFTLSACNGYPENQKPGITDTLPKKENNSIRGYFNNQQVVRVDSSQLKSFFERYPLLTNYSADVYQFYGYRQFHYAWYGGRELSEQANNLYNHLNNLELEGVQAPVPYKYMLDSLFNDPAVNVLMRKWRLQSNLSRNVTVWCRTVWQGPVFSGK
jgi:hypothetical protein